MGFGGIPGISGSVSPIQVFRILEMFKALRLRVYGLGVKG